MAVLQQSTVEFFIFSPEQIVPSTLNSLIRTKVLLQFHVCCWIHFAIPVTIFDTFNKFSRLNISKNNNNMHSAYFMSEKVKA